MTTHITDLDTQQVATKELAFFHKNPRHGDIDTIAESLKVNGQYRAIVVNRGTHTGRPMEVLAGNHTLKAALKLGWDTIAAHIIDIDDQQAARIVLADNRTSDLATNDDEDILDLLESLDTLEGTGYTDADLADMLDELTESEVLEEEEIPLVPLDPITVVGDIWHLGRHKVICGDATSANTFAMLLGDKKADCVWTDPPYGVNYVGKTKNALTIQNDGKQGLSDLLNAAFKELFDATRAGAAIYVAHADSMRIAFETALTKAGFQFRQNLIWVKNTIVLGHSDYHYQHEPILYGCRPAQQSCGGFGRGRGIGWHGDNSQATVFEVDKPNRNSEHPTMKPPELIQQMIRNSTQRGETVLDCFGGSGSTLIAAHNEGRIAALIELDPAYVDVICRRYQRLTGEKPVRDGEAVDFETTDTDAA